MLIEIILKPTLNNVPSQLHQIISKFKQLICGLFYINSLSFITYFPILENIVHATAVYAMCRRRWRAQYFLRNCVKYYTE